MFTRFLSLLWLTGVGMASALTEYATTDEALSAAREQKRAVMVDFTGTDWCPACIHLRHQIIDTPAFEQALGNQLVLVSVDFPRTPALREKITPKQWEEREEMLRSYGIEGLPAVVLMDAEGLPFALIQGARRTAGDYIPLVQEALKLREARDAALAEADRLTGMERARALVKALELLPEICRDKYHALIEEINRLDTDNSLGYRDLVKLSERRVQQLKAFRELTRTFVGKFKPEELHKTIEQLDAFLAQEDLLPEIRQQALAAKADSYAFLGDFRKQLDTLKKALEATLGKDVSASEATLTRAERKLRTNIEHLEKNVIPRL